MLEFLSAGLRIVAANAHAAAVRIAQAFKNFDCSGFSGAVRTEQAKHFAFFDAETHTTDRLHVAVLLDEIFDFQNGHLVFPTDLLKTKFLGYRRCGSGITRVRTSHEQAPATVPDRIGAEPRPLQVLSFNAFF